YAYEMLIAAQTEEDGIRADMGRTSVDGLYQVFREPQRKHTNIAANDPRLTPIASEADYRALLATGKYTRPPTAQEIEDQRVSEVNYLNTQIDNAVKKVRLAAASDLPFQSDAYHLKEEQAKAWDGTGEAPQMIQAVADRFEMSPLMARDTVIEKGKQWRKLLDDTETLRERGYALAQQNDVDGVTAIVGEILNPSPETD
ncbi:MAG: hypothetical protein ACRBBW_17225, partial [Cellvibrionaceae bacterium]